MKLDIFKPSHQRILFILFLVIIFLLGLISGFVYNQQQELDTRQAPHFSPIPIEQATITKNPSPSPFRIKV